MKVAVIGSGIGGLCAAVGLQSSGADVVVFERAAEVRSGGSGLSVFANGLRALDSLGLGEGFRAITSPEAALFRGGQRLPDGSWLSTYPMESLTELRVVDRARLHELLVRALPRRSLRTRARVVDVTEQGDVRYVSASGERSIESFDLVVAADGLRSTIRAGWPRDPGITYSGYSTWRGITEHPINLRGEAGETWGLGRRFGVAPLADGRAYWFAVLNISHDRRFADDVAALNHNFGDWHDPIPELIAATPVARISYLPIEELAGRVPSFVRGRIVLLGDAAHAMTPNLGQGGGQAMEDAATLSALLAPIAAAVTPDDASLHTALSRYDKLRRPRSQKIARRSRTVGQLAQVRGRTLAGVRNSLLRATPQSALRRQLAWLQNWTPPK